MNNIFCNCHLIDWSGKDKKYIHISIFNYKTYMNDVYKLKEAGSGAEKIIQKDDNFNPPEDKEGGYKKLILLDKNDVR